MPRALILTSGYTISERDKDITISFNANTGSYEIYNGQRVEIILVDEVYSLITDANRSKLPCSTYFQQSSSPASSQPATTFPIPNTPTIPPHVLVFLQESLASLEAQVGSIRKFLAATFQQ